MDNESARRAPARTTRPVVTRSQRRASTPSMVTMTVAEASLLLGLSESATYEAVARGEIPAIKIGRRVLVKREQLLAMLDGPPLTAETG